MITRLPFVACLAVNLALLAGCQQDAPSPRAEPTAEPAAVVAADPREAEVLSPPEYLSLPRFADADLRRGERLFLQCTVCHTLGPGEGHAAAGPNLWGMFGQRVARAPDFPYSPALRDFHGVWTPASLEQWLMRPATYIPGNSMPFAGIRDRDELTDLIAYLLRETSRER